MTRFTFICTYVENQDDSFEVELSAFAKTEAEAKVIVSARAENRYGICDAYFLSIRSKKPKVRIKKPTLGDAFPQLKAMIS